MATGKVVEAVAEEVAINLEEVAEVTRRINASSVSFFAGGLGAGIAIGFFFGYRFNKEKLRVEAFKESQEEVELIREDYRRKTIVAPEKPSMEEIIEKQGYSVATQDPPRPLPAPVPISPHPALSSPVVNNEKDKNTDWDYAEELANRTQEEPYIIHEDEMRNESPYPSATYTYYAEDDVLVDEDDSPITNRVLLIGENNLRFGHGSDSNDIVFVRNDRLELDMEICRSPGSFEREVIGLEHSDKYMERRRPSGRRNRSEDESS